jgi:hypothetical protein
MPRKTTKALTRGRPSTYSEATAAALCERIAEGQSLREIGRDEAMPAVSTVCLWLAQHEAFSEQYARARAMQADVLAQEIIEIADKADASTPTTLGKATLQIEARKWFAGKVRPKVYGEAKGPAVAIQNNVSQTSTFQRFTAPNDDA